MAVSMSVEIINLGVNTSSRTASYRLRALVTTSGQSYNDNQQPGSWQVKETQGANTGRTINGDFTSSIAKDATTVVLSQDRTIEYDAQGRAAITATVTFKTGISAGTITKSRSFTFPSIAASKSGSVTVLDVGITNYLDEGYQVLVGMPQIAGETTSYGYDVYVKEWGTLPTRGRVIGTGTAAAGSFVTLVWEPTSEQYAQYLTDAQNDTCVVVADFSSEGIVFESQEFAFPLAVPDSFAPTIGSLTITDSSGAYEEYGVAVPGRSNLTISFPVTSNSQSIITSVRANLFGLSRTVTIKSGSTYQIQDVEPSGDATGDGWIRAVDQRGFQTVKYVTIPVQNAEPPTISECRAYRYNTSTGQEDDESTTIRVEYNVGASALGSVAASGTVRIRYARYGSSSWTTAATRSFSATSSSGYVNISGCSTSYTYVIEIDIEASNGLSTVQTFEVGTATPIIDFYEDSGIAFWGVADQPGFVLYKSLYMDGALHMENGGHTWQQVIRNNNQVDPYRNVYPEFPQGLLVKSPEWLAFTNSASSALFEFARLNSSNEIELNWPEGGLQGMVLQRIWSGTWSSGTISVPQVGYYSFFIIFCGGTINGHRIFGARLPSQTQSGSSTGTIYGVGGAGAGAIGTYVYGTSLNISGTTLSCSGAPVGGFETSASGSTYNRITAPITSIWGVL